MHLPLTLGPKQTYTLPVYLLMPPLYAQHGAPGHSGVVCVEGGSGDLMGRNSLPPSLPCLKEEGALDSC